MAAHAVAVIGLRQDGFASDEGPARGSNKTVSLTIKPVRVVARPRHHVRDLIFLPYFAWASAK